MLLLILGKNKTMKHEILGTYIKGRSFSILLVHFIKNLPYY